MSRQHAVNSGNTTNTNIPRHFDDLIAGASAGVVGTVLGFPLDAIKSRMQIHSNKPIGWVLRSIYKEDGIRSFYRGLGSPLVALVILNSMNFTLYSSFRDALGRDSSFPSSRPGMDDNSNSYGTNFSSSSSSRSVFPTLDLKVVLAGAAVGPFAAFVSTPFEYLKMQMQFNRLQVAAAAAASASSAADGVTGAISAGAVSSTSPILYRNTMHAFFSILRTHGLPALYTAHGVNAAREMLFLGTYFGVYEHSKQAFEALFASISRYAFSSSSSLVDERLSSGGASSSTSAGNDNDSSGNSSRIAIPVAGGVSGAIGWLVSYPLDCIKGNLQGQPPGAYSTQLSLAERKKHTFTAVAREILQTRGVLGLYSGVSLSLLRAFLVSASRFSCYEGVLWALRRDQGILV